MEPAGPLSGCIPGSNDSVIWPTTKAPIAATFVAHSTSRAGVLCGTCIKGFGATAPFSCHRCLGAQADVSGDMPVMTQPPSRTGISLLYVLYWFVLLCWFLLCVWAAMARGRRRSPAILQLTSSGTPTSCPTSPPTGATAAGKGVATPAGAARPTGRVQPVEESIYGPMGLASPGPQPCSTPHALQVKPSDRSEQGRSYMPGKMLPIIKGKWQQQRLDVSGLLLHCVSDMHHSRMPSQITSTRLGVQRVRVQTCSTQQGLYPSAAHRWSPANSHGDTCRHSAVSRGVLSCPVCDIYAFVSKLPATFPTWCL